MLVGFVSETGAGFPSGDPADEPDPNVVTATVDGDPVDCCLTIAEIIVKDRAVKFKITNNLGEHVTISAIAITWPSSNGGLKKIKRGGDTIYDQLSAPPALLVDSGWEGAEDRRRIDPGKTEEIKFEFERNASAAGHNVHIDFVTPPTF